ncbi:DUF882 domain-containing protein [Caldimonas tepidiphila]|uniref:DUF882 domain-containing protein n=1 Tax=Caldimonas tepidiphila TaxID=2315841 RepID=UPI000E5B0217
MPALAVPALAVPALARAHAAEPRTLTFSHLHTGERLVDIEYFSGGSYLPDALGEINRLLRDFRTGEVAPIDPQLLDLLHGLSQLTGSTQPFQIISAYRSPATNAMLRARSTGVASGSLHLSGRAIDIRVADVPLARLRQAALALGRGGVGYYPGSNFVHVDTGRVRAW